MPPRKRQARPPSTSRSAGPTMPAEAEPPAEAPPTPGPTGASAPRGPEWMVPTDTGDMVPESVLRQRQR